METEIESLERATLDAVGPAEMHALPNWLLPFDRSTVGRAISAVPLRHTDLDPALIAEIEAHYDSGGQRQCMASGGRRDEGVTAHTAHPSLDFGLPVRRF